MNRSVKILLVIGIAASCLIGLVVAQTLRTKSSSRATLEKIKNTPDEAVNFTNFPMVPMTIVSAGSKVLVGDEFRALTGEELSGTTVTSLPNVVLTNSSGKRILKFIVIVGNRKTKKAFTLSFGSVNIAPNEGYSISSAEWRGGKQVSLANQSQLSNSTVRPAEDFDSPKLWWVTESVPSDLTVRVARVEFEDGTAWLMDEASGGMTW